MVVDYKVNLQEKTVLDLMSNALPYAIPTCAQSRLSINRNTVLVFFLIVLSGNPLVVYSTEWMYAGYIVVLLFYLCVHNKLVLSKYVWKWLIGFVVLFVAQFIFVRTVSLPADINFLAKFIIAYITASLCGENFSKIYTDIMYVICLISLLFFGLHCIHIPIPGLQFDRYTTIGIWNYITNSSSLRNCGMFWEPGAFQGFIMLPFLLYIGKLKWFWQHKRKQIIIFIIALLSTLSTTAYIVAFLYGILILMSSKIRILYKALVVVIALIGATVAYFSLDFLGNKIQDQIETTDTNSTNKANWSRTGALIIEISNLARHPFTGNGFLLESRYKGLGDKMSGAGNGLAGIINMLGIPMVLAYFIGVAYSWRNTRRAYRLTVVVVLMALLFGEFFLNYPLYWSLLFVKLPYQPKIKRPLLATPNKL